jgi:hypothetical protein
MVRNTITRAERGQMINIVREAVNIVRGYPVCCNVDFDGVWSAP